MSTALEMPWRRGSLDSALHRPSPAKFCDVDRSSLPRPFSPSLVVVCPSKARQSTQANLLKEQELLALVLGLRGSLPKAMSDSEEEERERMRVGRPVS
jgi:rhodanese-related sulfurtransferase